MKIKWTGILGLLLTVLWACDEHTIRRNDYPVSGIDISHYQSFINWDTVAAQNIDFAFVKATEGISLSDTMFCYNWSEMKRVGIKRGAYHFFRPTIPVQEQVDNFTQMVELDYGDLPPVLDVEALEGVSKTILINGVRNWLYLMEIHYNVKPIIYTNLKFYNKILAGHFDEYPIWIARYSFREPTLACGRDWHFWQYGNRGRIKGIYGNVDFNVFNGSQLDLERLCLAPNNIILSNTTADTRQFLEVD